MKPPNLRFAILAVDVAVITVIARAPHVLLMPVHLPPDITHAQALPGGLVRPDETAEDAVARHLAKKCDLTNIYSEQIATFSGIDRDPRGCVVSVAYLALVPEPIARRHPLPHGLRWCEITKVGKLAYDHNAIASAARDRLRARLQALQSLDT
jgi:8-oxo-dGTP diphosphatase